MHSNIENKAKAETFDQLHFFTQTARWMWISKTRLFTFRCCEHCFLFFFQDFQEVIIERFLLLKKEWKPSVCYLKPFLMKINRAFSFNPMSNYVVGIKGEKKGCLMELMCDSDSQKEVLFCLCSHKHCFWMLISSYGQFREKISYWNPKRLSGGLLG